MNNWGAKKHTFGHWLLYVMISIVLTACGGGDDQLPLAPSSSTPPPVVTPTNPAFSFSAPAANAEIPLNTATTITVTYLDSAGAPKAGETVYFTSSRGTLSAASATTDASGKASVTVSSTSAGSASIKANTTGGTQSATRTVLFVSTTPASISVQAESTILAKGASTAITATVLDGSGNPVKGTIVGFTLISDSSGGQLSDPTATTNASGKASVTFTAGSLTTATNGVAIRATVQGSPAITTDTSTAPLDAKLTVSGSALFISLTSTNTISEKTTTSYALPYGILVTDASGKAVANTVVTLSVIPTGYYKGEYVWNTRVWVPTYSTSVCPNEDTDLDGILDSGEDFNGNAMLDPGLPVSVPGPVTTDANGLASFELVYGKNFSNWVKVSLKATATVAGSESVKTQDFIPPAMSTDVNSETKSPPGGGNSPFGTAADCGIPD